jgi:predicted RNase H-like HicB family nuclease/predicted RNA binding protein YcfA (HicA-like mRNA interferase family)
MGRKKKLLLRIVQGRSDNNIAFSELTKLLESLGFQVRIRGSHHLYRKEGIQEMINLQKDGNNAKPYQVKQVRAVLFKYEIIIYWSNDDNAFVAEVPELPGCMAHGDTYESALNNAQDAIQHWLDIAREQGDTIPEPQGRKVMSA